MVLDSDDKCAEASRNNSASPTTNPSGTVSLHPPFIMNIFEHWTRIATQNGSPQHVIGGLIGNRSGPNVEVMNSFELEFNFSDHDIIIDKEKCRNKQQEYIDKQPSTDSEFLGWYSIGNHPTEENIKVHKQICEINKSSIMLQLSPQSWKID
ncbi:COP9 signalosome complex subunit 6-like, partial [Sitodiplosis mosellana]